MNIEYGTGSRIYTLAVSGETADQVTFNVPLVDTLGNVISCNYVDVQVVANEATIDDCIFLNVELSGLGAASPPVSAMVSSVSTERFSFGATCGFTIMAPGYGDDDASPGANRYCWHGWRRDEVSGLKFTALGDNSGRKINLVINYGNLIHYNKPFTNIIETIGQ